MIDLSKDDRIAIRDTLRREVNRLEETIRDYQASRSNTRNMVVRNMADEGMRTARERIVLLNRLADRIDPDPKEAAEVAPKRA